MATVGVGIGVNGMRKDEYFMGMSTLQSMFPGETKERLHEALQNTCDVEKAIDYIIGNPGRKYKNIILVHII